MPPIVFAFVLWMLSGGGAVASAWDLIRSWSTGTTSLRGVASDRSSNPVGYWATMLVKLAVLVTFVTVFVGTVPLFHHR